MDPLIARQIGNYRIDRLLGEGGMGRVYAGSMLTTGRTVAIKVIADEHANNAELVGRFYAEADAASRIRHPGIVEVLDLAYLEDGRPAIVMELLAGRTLRELFAERLLPIATAMDLVGQVLEAVGAAHAAGIVHRDLKPDNIVVDYQQRVKVLDFGIAKLTGESVGEGAPRTRTGMMLGTPEYMAPEQVTGSPIDARTDVYALGIVLYEALAGHRPFGADNQFEILRAHLETPPPPLRREGLGDVQLQVVMRALAKRPDERFQSAADMAAAIRGERIAVPVATIASVPRRRWPVISIVALVTIGIGAAMAAKHGAAPAPAPPSPIVAAPRVAPPIAPAAPVAVVVPVVPSNPDVGNYPAPAAPAAFDATAFLVDSTRYARAILPDAEPIFGEFYAVKADGLLDLAAQPGNPHWMFWSPAASVRPKNLAPNQEFRGKCAVYVDISTAHVQAIHTATICDRKSIAAPRCTLRQLWDRAAKQGADRKYVADIQFVDGRWFFRLDANQLSLELRDDCH